MSRRGHYLGGHTILHGDPHGGVSTPDNRPKKIKAAEARQRSKDFYEEVEANIGRVARERAALRKIIPTGGDEVDLGCKSSGWADYKIILRARLLFLRKANIHRADQIAKALNRMGFKTGSGKSWNPRLVNVAKMKIFAGKAERG
jgi:hypothetical protein